MVRRIFTLFAAGTGPRAIAKHLNAGGVPGSDGREWQGHHDLQPARPRHAEFAKEGDVRDFWTERVISGQDEVVLTWHEIGEPLLLHTQPHAAPERPYGVCTVLIPALAARLTVNGEQAGGRPFDHGDRRIAGLRD